MTLELSQALFIGLLGCVALHRLVELVWSRRRQKARGVASQVSEPVLFPLMAALHAGLIVLPAVEVLARDLPFRPWLAAVAGAVLVVATALRVWTLRTIGRSWNVRVVVPEPDAIATSGPYRWIRHPNYLVVILEIASLPLLHGAWLSALGLTLLNAVVLTRRIRTEEHTLQKIPAWQAAMRDRSRLIPGVL